MFPVCKENVLHYCSWQTARGMIWESDKDMIKKCLQLTLKSGTGGFLDEIFYEWKSLLSRFESQVDEYIN